MHFDIGRRYADASFRRNIAGLSDNEALDMFTDAANKLQDHYVQNPDWAALINRGTHDLEIALAEPSFQESNQSRRALTASIRFCWNCITSKRSILCTHLVTPAAPFGLPRKQPRCICS